MRTIFLIPLKANSDLSTIALRLSSAIGDSIKTNFMPLCEESLIRKNLLENHLSDLLEDIALEYKNFSQNEELVITNGLALTSFPYASDVNLEIAVALDAVIIFVLSARSPDLMQELQNLKILANTYANRNRKVLGCLLEGISGDSAQICDQYNVFAGASLNLLGTIDKQNLDLTDRNWLKEFLAVPQEKHLTPPFFRVELMQRARALNKRIVLPEGDEPRTIKAANICAEKGIARPVLLGSESAIKDSARKIGITLHQNIEIIDAEKNAEKYAVPLFELRKHKGLTLEEARKQLSDNVMIGTMMLQLGEVDGLVSGAIHTTANTIRPALQIVKMQPNVSIVSSVLFICLPEQVFIYGDCAINQNPKAEELADIAIQSADTAQKFGIPPRVALLSYSTGDSGFGPDIDLVKAALEIAKQKRPDLLIEGPIQYDAAVDLDVAKLKMPNSKVAGKATVFIFPNLNAGNIAYKAVQRSTGIICVGPLLQGLRKPVNDLSRGCLVEDIVFTIALTAVQAE